MDNRQVHLLFLGPTFPAQWPDVNPTEGTQEAVWAVLVDAVKKPFHDTLLATFLFPTNKVTKPLINYTGMGIDGVRRSHVAF